MKITWKIAVLGMICFFFHIATVCPVWADISENPTISVTPAYQSVDRSSGNINFEVSNTGADALSWNAAVVSGDDWLTITEGNSGTDAGTISCEYEANTIASPRTATIQITVS